MQPVDLVIAARWIIPVEPLGTVLEHHALAVHQDRIIDLLPADAARQRYAAGRWLDRDTHVLLPGLINAHTHAPMSLFRGMADDLPLDRWLHDHIWPAEGRWVTADFVRDGAELAMLEMLRGGTTCFSDMYFFPDVVARAAAEHGLRARVGMIALEFPTVWASTPEEYLEKGLAVHDQYRGHPTIGTAFAPHAPYTVSDDTLERIRVLADELEVPMVMHVHETAAEIENHKSEHGCRPIQRLDRLGVLNPLLAAVHMTQLESGEIPRIAESGSSVIHCPESNLKLASGFCPVSALVAAGVNVALGTDGAASNNDLDMFGEMRTCALLAKGVADDASALPAAKVLSMATINGARALGLADRTGSLVPGKQADLICVDLAPPATQPVYHPVSQLVYAASRDQVSDVWVAGRQLLDDGTYTQVDPAPVLGRAAAWREKISSQA